MADPRISYGLNVEAGVKGPYGVQPAHRDGSGNDGGALRRLGDGGGRRCDRLA